LQKLTSGKKLKEKLNVDFRKYKIPGDCNLAYANKALQMEVKVGTKLPCSALYRNWKPMKFKLRRSIRLSQ